MAPKVPHAMDGDPPDKAGPDRGRRGFLESVGALFAGAVATLPALLAGAAALLDPVRRASPDPSWVRIATLSAIPDGAPPRRVTVVSERVDAWTTYQRAPVGAVFLAREGDRLRALNVVCPHAGCSVGLAPGGTHFACPCHRSRFTLDGTRVEGPSPRDLDRLEVEAREDDVWVRFQNFRPGVEEKVPV